MKRHYIFASHGTLARGILDSVELILGKQQDIHTLCAYVDENQDVTGQVKFHLIAGLNLPLVIGLLISADEPDTDKLIHEALFSARESIQYCNHTIASAVQADKDF